MKKDLILTFATTMFALAVGFVLIRMFAPRLLPVATDLHIVQEDRTVPPFYDNIFLRTGEQTGPDHYVLLDPVIKHRAPPFYPDRMGIGPNDLLGFRNRSVPSKADVITIGDSQTYGNNSILEENWPSQMARLLNSKRPMVYNMSTGGWGPVQYLAALDYAFAFQPRVIVVTFYTGNDSLEGVVVARNMSRWKTLLDDIDVDQPEGVGKERIRLPERELWRVRLGNRRQVEFTPSLRLACNDRTSANVRLGYRLAAKIGALMVEKARNAGVKILFTIIPTKELAYRDRLKTERISLDAAYDRLIADEVSNVEELKEALVSAGGDYADVIAPLQKAVEARDDLYPFNEGHPAAQGYAVIAATIAQAIDQHLPNRPSGFVAAVATKGYGYDEVYEGMSGSAHLLATAQGKLAVLFIDDRGVWTVPNPKAVRGLDPDMLPVVSLRDISTLPMKGFLDPSATPGAVIGKR